ncbi:hypothetical protein [Hymenobacter bucti]|uniref:Uncharacterized protein n=1 Tax=Hymenobacter bucti TaxID=1844114 RepID=A0ABW4QWU5_9BACT
MNPRDLPEVVAKLIMEMHEAQAKLRGLREDMQAMPDRIGMAVVKSLESFLKRLLEHDGQVKNHEQRLNRLENPQA